MRVGVGSDHAGFAYKGLILEHLRGLGHEAVDFGTFSPESTDYPTFIRPVAQAVANGEIDRGIVLGGSGNGEAIVANRIAGVRCAVVWNDQTAALGREHNDANVISIGERMMSAEQALRCVDIFLTTPFEGGRHARRVAMIDKTG